MELKSIQEILKFVNKSNLTEVEIEKKDFRLKIKRSTGENVVIGNIPVAQPMAQLNPFAIPAQEAPAEKPTADTPAKDNDQAETNDGLIEFKSPMIGTFYRASSPDLDPFIKVGDVISKGQIVCVIEAMKLFNEIESDFEGKVVKILVENSQPVEYDQPLFLIEAN